MIARQPDVPKRMDIFASQTSTCLIAAICLLSDFDLFKIVAKEGLGDLRVVADRIFTDRCPIISHCELHIFDFTPEFRERRFARLRWGIGGW